MGYLLWGCGVVRDTESLTFVYIFMDCVKNQFVVTICISFIAIKQGFKIKWGYVYNGFMKIISKIIEERTFKKIMS